MTDKEFQPNDEWLCDMCREPGHNASWLGSRWLCETCRELYKERHGMKAEEKTP